MAGPSSVRVSVTTTMPGAVQVKKVVEQVGAERVPLGADHVNNRSFGFGPAAVAQR